MANKLYIPTIGDHLVLTKPWKFKLYDEYRNSSWWDKMNPKKPSSGYWGDADKFVEITLPPGTILSVDRIYIRKSAKDYDSVTFRVLKGSPVPHGRFWAKLRDVNDQLEFTHDETNAK